MQIKLLLNEPAGPEETAISPRRIFIRPNPEDQDMNAQTLIGKDELRMLTETRNLLDELLETLDILGDPESMTKLDEAQADVRRGRLHDLADL